jgi:leucyl-tRNA synthetase
LQTLDESLPAASPIVSTIGFEGEGQLRRLRRLSVADVLVRYISQTVGQPATLLDVAVAEGADEAARRQLIPRAIEAFNRLLRTRLVISGNRLVLSSDDLLELVLEAGKELQWPEAILAAQRVAIGRSRGAFVRFARTDGGGDIEVFTTRPDTLFGASFVAVSPSHPVAQLAEPARLEAFRAECDRAGRDPNVKVGVPLGLSVHHPFTPQGVLPVWLTNFVVETYGTGAAGGCPACDQRDLDFARRYRLGVSSIICPPGMDPATYQVGASAYAGDGTIINSGFLSGLPVAKAIGAAMARLVELGRGRPAVQFRRRPLVVAEAASTNDGEVHHLNRPWRFTVPFLTAAALILPAAGAHWWPHLLHVTAPETATQHLLDTRILSRALGDGRGSTHREPWEEIVLIGNVSDSSEKHAPGAPLWERDALRLAVLADTPPDRELEWSDRRYAAALKFVAGAHKLFSPPGRAQGIGKATLAKKVAKASASLDSALRRRRTNTAVAAVREIVGDAAESAERAGLDSSAQAFVASLLYPLLPDLAAKGLAAAGAPPITPPAWPDVAEQGGEAELIELIVQINGKKRGAVHVAPNADQEMVIKAIRADGSLKPHLGQKPIRKVIVVPNRLVNLVI